MRVRLSIAVQTHPRRADLAAALAALVGGGVVMDPEPQSAARSPWRTYRRCLEETPPGCTHRLILQDDVEVCPGFRQAAESAIAAHPDAVMCFFVQGYQPYSQRVMWACQNDKPICDLNPQGWVPAVGTCWPAGAALAVPAFVDTQPWANQIRADDEVIGRAARGLGLRVLATVPSLVEHPDEVPSVGGSRRAMAGADPTRVAACFIHADDDATLIDWRCEPSLRETWT